MNQAISSVLFINDDRTQGLRPKINQIQEISQALGQQQRVNCSNQTAEHISKSVYSIGHCDSIIQQTTDWYSQQAKMPPRP